MEIKNWFSCAEWSKFESLVCLLRSGLTFSGIFKKKDTMAVCKTELLQQKVGKSLQHRERLEQTPSNEFIIINALISFGHHTHSGTSVFEFFFFFPVGRS